MEIVCRASRRCRCLRRDKRATTTTTSIAGRRSYKMVLFLLASMAQLNARRAPQFRARISAESLLGSVRPTRAATPTPTPATICQPAPTETTLERANFFTDENCKSINWPPLVYSIACAVIFGLTRCRPLAELRDCFGRLIIESQQQRRVPSSESGATLINFHALFSRPPSTTIGRRRFNRRPIVHCELDRKLAPPILS